MLHEVIHLKDIYPFLGEDGCDPVLTTYLPYNDPDGKPAENTRPALLICPGGGYRYVSPREAEPVAMNFMPDGYNVFVLTYSVAPKRFPTAIREVAAAMEVIYANADKWITDIKRIAIMGFSAGGHLACHYSNCFDCPEVRAAFPESKPVQAAVLCYPVVTGDPVYRHKGSFVDLTGHEEPTEEDVEKFSLQNRVSEKTPPTFLWHTRTDRSVPVMNTLLYAQALAKQGTPFSVHIYPFGAHGLSTADEQTNTGLKPEAAMSNDWMQQAKKWLKFTL